VEIAAGECVVLAGRNGSGKTTLLRIAAQLVRPSAGKLTFPSASAETRNGGSPNGSRATAYVAHATMVYDELTAEENLMLFARLVEVSAPRPRVDALLAEVGLTERRDSL